MVYFKPINIREYNNTMDQDRTILKLEDIDYKNPSGVSIFNKLSFTLEKGRTAVINGPTGSGKSSLVELIIGSKMPVAGDVYLFGQRLNKSGRGQVFRLRRMVGGVGGIFQLIESRTVKENILLPLIIRGEKTSLQKKKANRVMNQLGLTSWQNDLAGDISQGQKNMVMLARAVVADQPLLLIDEPLAGLDKDTAQHVNKTLQSFAIGGHSMLIMTSGQTGLFIPEAKEYHLSEGVLR